MTGLPTPTDGIVKAMLHAQVGASAARGAWMRAASVLALAAAALIAGLWLTALVDAIAVIERPWIRSACLAVLLCGSAGSAVWLVTRYLASPHRALAAAERIEAVAQRPGQPVVRGLTMMESGDDALTSALHARAIGRATAAAEAAQPAQVFPCRALRWPLGLAGLAAALWLAVLVAFPGQFMNVLGRVAWPWGDAPPFSLTALEPTGLDDVTAGDNVWLQVDPQGLQPRQVDFVLLNEQGREAQRFAMDRLPARGQRHFFSRVLHRVDAPITFKLEAFGRPTRAYTIDPKPAAAPEPPSLTAGPESGGGRTSYNPNAAAERDLQAHPAWAGLRERAAQLAEDLQQAQRQALQADPADHAAMQALDRDLQALAARAEQLSDEMRALQAQLPPAAAARLDKLIEALSQMRCQALGACPVPTNAQGQDPASSPPKPAALQWLEQAAQAAGADARSLAAGLGQASTPTPSGTASGSQAGAPVLIDPAATGTADERGRTADTGVLPPAVMQQVPPGYRPLIHAYFTRLAEEDAPTENAP